jgi:hypothetical protein
MTMRTVLTGLGILAIVVSALADWLGLGQEPRFGWKQGIGVAVGCALVVGGLLLRRAPR